MGDLDKTAANFFSNMAKGTPTPAPVQAPQSPWQGVLNYLKGTEQANAVPTQQVEAPPAVDPYQHFIDIMRRR